MVVVLIFGGVAFVSTLAWKLYQLYRAPWHLPTWAVTTTLACGLLAYQFQSSAVHNAVDGAAGPGWANLVENVLLMVGSWSLILFFLFSSASRRRAVRGAWREAAVLALAIVLLVVCTVATPVAERGKNLSQANMSIPGVAGFYLFGGLYLIYALARALRWIISYAADAEPRLRRGLLLAGFGLAGMIVGSAARAVLVVLRYLGSPPYPPVNAVASTLVALGILLFLTGVTYPGVCTRLAALRLWHYRRRAYHELAPLWTALHDAFPQTALDRLPVNRLRDRCRLRQVHRRYYRRVIEIRDGLVQISPYLPAEVEPGAAPMAETLRAALAARAAGAGASARARLIAGPTGDGIDADMGQLLAISRTIQHT